jgi:hypothetical protein
MPTAQLHGRPASAGRPRAAVARAHARPAPSPARRPSPAGAASLARLRARDDALGTLLQRCVAGRCDCGGDCGDKEKEERRRLVQRTPANGPTLARVADPKACCKDSDCSVPDEGGSGAGASKWTLTIAVDREEKGFDRLMNPREVGHTWVKLESDAGERWSFGMWPKGGFDFFKPVDGCVHHPDTAHEGDAYTERRYISYDISREKYYDALSFAQQQCEMEPKYDLQNYNCTTFAISTAIAAGVTPPASTTLAIHNPNALYSGIGKELKKRGELQDAPKGSGSLFGKGGPAVQNGMVMLQRAVQQRATGPTLSRLGANECSRADNCMKPDFDSLGGDPTRWTLSIMVDRESEGLWGRVVNSEVGHTWVKLSHDKGEIWSFGMWPKVGFNALAPGKDVDGCIHHPDRAHAKAPANHLKEMRYDLNEKQYADALEYCQTDCARRPKYNLFEYNCTTFAIEVAKAARVKPPASESMAIHNPNALYEGIEKDLEEQAAAPMRNRGGAIVNRAPSSAMV